MNKRLLLLLSGAAGLAVVQQQLLLQRPPRLLKLAPQPIHSGSAGLDLNFSRPMDRASIAEASWLKPSLPHRWLGQGKNLRLVVDAEQPIRAPLALNLSGSDQRNQVLHRQRWWWDPRPWLVVNRLVAGGEQLQLQRRDGSWLPLTPVWPAISQVVPLGNGQGIAVISGNGAGEERIWLQRLEAAGLQQSKTQLQEPRRGSLQSIGRQPLLFGHVSSNLEGDLLVQTGGFEAGSQTTALHRSNGRKQPLELPSSGPVQLIPGGGGMVVPIRDGLQIAPLTADQGGRAQILPGSRELGAFCPASGRAVLVRHWPDYRRSIELVIPGLAPRQLHLGDQAVLAVACNNAGTKIWAVLGRWTSEGRDQVMLLMDETGRIQRQRQLDPWMLQPGTKLQLNAVGGQLLMSVNKDAQNLAGRAALMDATSLDWIEIGDIPIKEAVWISS